MASAILLIVITISTVLQNIFKKQYNGKTKNTGAITFCFISAFCAIPVFIATANHPMIFSSELIPHSIAFAVSYAVALVFSIYALQYGSLAITSLILAYSLLIPTLNGIIFFHEEPKWSFWGGIILLMISIFLINYKNEKDTESANNKFSFKWIIFVALAFIGNGMCSTTQSIQIKAFSHLEYTMTSEYMILALIISTVVMVIVSLFSERNEIIPATKKGWFFAVLCGVINGLTNYMVIAIQKLNELPVSVIFPCISGGGMILTFIVSLTLFKEKMTKAQTVGFFVGVASVVLLNL